MEYWVKKPTVSLNPVPSFSEPEFVLKHEMVHYSMKLINAEAYNYGVTITISIDPVDDAPRMTFMNETPRVEVGRQLVAITPVNASSHDEEGTLLLTPAIILEVIEEDESPDVIQELYAEDGGDVLDRIVLTIEPYLNIWDNEYNKHDFIRMYFDARVLTDVKPDMELPVTAEAVFHHLDYSHKNVKKLTVTDQPFLPVIPPMDPEQHPDTGDDIVFTFDLSLVIEGYVNDTWMNVTCPDLRTVNHSLEFDFYEPENYTGESDCDIAFHTESTYHLHLTSLLPEVNFHGNHTFHFWDNTMMTHQQIQCYVMLSFRVDEEELVIPYIAGGSKPLTAPGISYDLYRVGASSGDDDVGGNETESEPEEEVYGMPIGSNVTYILNITFPEVTTKVRFNGCKGIFSKNMVKK